MPNQSGLPTRRALLGAAAVAAPTVAFSATDRNLGPLETSTAVSKADMMDSDVVPGKRISINGDRSQWEWQAGNFTKHMATDPLHGLYQPHRKIPVATGCWVRLWDGITGYPEWFGAIPDDGTHDSLPALQACLALCPITLLAPVDYYISATLKLNTAYRTIRGHAQHWGKPGDSTRIILKSARGDVVQLGPDKSPGSINDFLTEVTLESLCLSRSEAVMPPTTGYRNGPSGLRIQFALYARVNNVWSTEHSIGFLFAGAVNSFVANCYAFRSRTGANSKNDFFHGYFYDGAAKIGAAGGNASLYLKECNTAVGGAPGLTITSGIYCERGWTDFFVSKHETVTTQYGIYMSGADAPASGTQDCTIEGCKFDQFSIAGVYVADGGRNSNLSLIDIYAAPTSARTAIAGFQFSNTLGSISMIGGFVLGVNNVKARGIYVNNAAVNVRDTMIFDCPYPVVIEPGQNCFIAPIIENPTVTAPLGAVYVSARTTRNVIAPVVKGSAGKFAKGVDLSGVANSYTEVQCSGIDPACIKGGAGNKLVSNGVAITTAGAFSTNCLASGIMG